MSARRSWWIAAASLFLIGATYALATPLTAGPDEAAHAIRAAAVARGQFSTAFRTVDVPGGFTKPITDVSVPRPYAELPDVLTCLGFTSDRAASCARPIATHGPVVHAETYVGAYPPTYYAIVGWPSRLVGTRAALYLMRLVGVALCAALFASALRSLLDGATDPRRRGWTTAGVLAAATPITMFLAGTVNPSGLEVAAAVCLWASLLALLDRDEELGWRLPARVAVAGVLLCATRPLSPLWTAGIAAVVLLAAARRAAPAWRDRRAQVAMVAVVVATVGMEVLALVQRSPVAVITSPPGAARSHLWYAREAATRTFDWLDQLVGVLGWRDVPLWPVVTPLWGLVVAGLVVVAWRRAGGRQRLGLGLTAVAVLVAPIAAEVASGQVVGMAWQGRYVLPVAVGLPIQAAWVLARSPASDAAVRFERRWTPAVAVVLAACHGAALLRVLDRYAAGLPSGVLVALRTDGGAGPIGWRPLVVLVLVSAAAVAATWVALIAWPGERNSADSRYPQRRRRHGTSPDSWEGSCIDVGGS